MKNYTAPYSVILDTFSVIASDHKKSSVAISENGSCEQAGKTKEKILPGISEIAEKHQCRLSPK